MESSVLPAYHVVQWEDHFSHLATTLKSFSLSCVLTDTVLVSGKERMAVHGPVLSGFTRYFDEFTRKDNIVLMEDMDHAVVQGIVDYIYTGSVSIPRNDVIKLYRMAELLRMDGFPQFESFNDTAVSHFTWPKHRDVLLECLWHTRLQTASCDVVFLASDQYRTHAHSAVLGACSQYLLGILESHGQTERKPFLFVLHDVSGKILELVLEFCYKGEVRVVDEDVKSVYSVAKLLGVHRLCDKLTAVDRTLSESHYHETGSQYRSIIRSSHSQDVLARLQEHESLTDLFIVVDNHTFKAHCVVLSAFSSYFRDLARCLGSAMKDTFVLVEGNKTSHVQAFLDYVYRGEASFNGTVDEFCASMAGWLDFGLLPVSLESSETRDWTLLDNEVKDTSAVSESQPDGTSKDGDDGRQDQQLLGDNWQNDPVLENTAPEDEATMKDELLKMEYKAEDEAPVGEVESQPPNKQVCYTCKETFPTRQQLRDHLSVHPDGRTLRCKFCNKGFGKPSQMKLHLRTHTGDKPFRCAKCGTSFAAKSALTKHLDTHEKDKSKAFVCDVCQKSFSRKEYLEEHIRTHTGSKPYSCPVCHKTFVGRTGLNHHKKTHEEEKRSAVCEICGKSFTRHALWTHVKSHDKVHECDVCHKLFATKTALKIHVAGIHFGHRWHQCEICGKGFMQKYHLVRHKKVHEKETEENRDDPFACSKCSQTFKSESKLDAHMRSEHRMPGYACNICHKRFAGRSTVIYHRRAHTGERPHRCQHCGKAFVRPDTLRQHVRSHTGERLFECTACGKKCSTRSALNKHALSHKEPHSLTCPVCGKAFDTKDQLSEHSKLHGGSRPFRCNTCRKSFRYQDSLDKHLRIHSSNVVLQNAPTDDLSCIYSFEVCRQPFEDLNPKPVYAATDYNICEDKNPVLLPRRPYSITIEGNLCCNSEPLIPTDVSSVTMVPPHADATPTTHTELNPVPVDQTTLMTSTSNVTYPSILSKAFSL